MMRNYLLNWIKKFDRNIHPKRISSAFEYLNTILVTIYALLISICIGIIGFMVIEKMDIIDSFYMTIITISTVGFGEVRELSHAGRLFVSFLIITNIGVFAYAVSNLGSFFVEGKAKRIFSDLFVGRKIDKMKEHIIVCGYGRYGKSVIENLLQQDLQCVLIETDIKKVETIRKDKRITVLEGDATDEETLLEAGIDHARALITTLPVDAHNVYTILTARQINSELKIISRANAASSKSNMIRAGANEVLIPENIGGFYMSALVTKPDIINVFTDLTDLETKGFQMAEILITSLPNRMRGKHLGDLDFEQQSGIKIIGLKQPNADFIVNPKDDTILEVGMGMLVIGNQDQIDRFHLLTKEFEIIQ